MLGSDWLPRRALQPEEPLPLDLSFALGSGHPFPGEAESSCKGWRACHECVFKRGARDQFGPAHGEGFWCPEMPPASSKALTPWRVIPCGQLGLLTA